MIKSVYFDFTIENLTLNNVIILTFVNDFLLLFSRIKYLLNNLVFYNFKHLSLFILLIPFLVSKI
jgi:hypothetical protein